MFPDIRLMIAAVLATVVVLICGFGMFAAFRISHEPLKRLPVASAPIELSSDDAANRAGGSTGDDPFDRRFQTSVAMLAVSKGSNAAAQPPDRRNETDPRVTAEASTAAPADANEAEPRQPIDQTSVETRPQEALATSPVTGPKSDAEQAPPALAQQQQSEPRASAPPEVTSDAENQIPATIAAGPVGAQEEPPLPALVTAALPPEQIVQPADEAPAAAAKSPAKASDKASGKSAKAKSSHAAKVHRARKVTTAYYPQPNNQVGFAQPGFQTATATAPRPPVARRPARTHLVKAAPERTKHIAALKAKKLAAAKAGKDAAKDKADGSAPDKTSKTASDKSKIPEAGMGGPFVPVPPASQESQGPSNPPAPPLE